MLTSEQSNLAAEFLNLLFPELLRLGINQESPDYQILLIAIENLLPDHKVESIRPSVSVKKVTPDRIAVNVKSEPFANEAQEGHKNIEYQGSKFRILPSLPGESPVHRTFVSVNPAVKSEPGLVEAYHEDAELLTMENSEIATGFPLNTAENSHSSSLSINQCLDSSMFGREKEDVSSDSYNGAPEHELIETGVTSGVPESSSCSSGISLESSKGLSERYSEVASDDVYDISFPVTIKSNDTNGKRTRLRCSVCLKSFIRNSDLSNYLSTHEKGRPFKCAWEGCSKVFSHQSFLVRHLKLHTDHDRPFDCLWEGCSKTFTQRYNLKVHARIHIGYRPFTCSWENCSKSFSRRSNLMYHMKIHTNELRMHCPWEGCNRSFRLQSQLNAHTRRHASENPQTCPWDGCGESFTSKSDLDLHSKTHSDESCPFKCYWAGCSRAFSSQRDLLQHSSTHIGY